MTELLDHQVHEGSEALVLDDVQLSHLADVAIDSTLSIELETREIEIGGRPYRTSIPEGINPFENGVEGRDVTEAEIIPSILDQIPAGKYTVFGEGHDIATGQNERSKRTFDIHANETGLAINTDIFINAKSWKINPDCLKLFSTLGYEFDDEQIIDGYLNPSAVPLPETLVTAAKARGLDIKLFSDQGLITPTDYLGAFAEGKYPVSTASEGYYRHDISATHLKVMLLGGEDLMDILSSMASQALQGDQERIGLVAGAFDRYTEALADIYDELGYSRTGAISEGEKAGITQEQTERIIKVIQDRAKEAGILPEPSQVESVGSLEIG